LDGQPRSRKVVHGARLCGVRAPAFLHEPFLRLPPSPAPSPPAPRHTYNIHSCATSLLFSDKMCPLMVRCPSVSLSLSCLVHCLLFSFATFFASRFCKWSFSVPRPVRTRCHLSPLADDLLLPSPPTLPHVTPRHLLPRNRSQGLPTFVGHSQPSLCSTYLPSKPLLLLVHRSTASHPLGLRCPLTKPAAGPSVPHPWQSVSSRILPYPSQSLSLSRRSVKIASHLHFSHC
jgi:hypothetical protein